MDWDTGAYQRRQLDHMRAVRERTPLPDCDEGPPCMDGRCSQCGSDMNSILNGFAIQSMREPLRMGAFKLPNTAICDGSMQPADFEKVREVINRIIAYLANEALILVATVGIVYEEGHGQKVCAFELSYVNGENIFRDDFDLEELAGEPLSLMPFGGPRPFYLDGIGAFRENLLYGYVQRSTSIGDTVTEIINGPQIDEIAENYGGHRITDRVVSYGVGVENNRLIPVSGCRKQIALERFGELDGEA